MENEVLCYTLNFTPALVAVPAITLQQLPLHNNHLNDVKARPEVKRTPLTPGLCGNDICVGDF